MQQAWRRGPGVGITFAVAFQRASTAGMGVPVDCRSEDESMNLSVFERLKRFDDQRSSLPGEHWVTLGAGLWLLARPCSSTVERLASLAAGAALVWRAASGRDGFARKLGWGKSQRSTQGRKRGGNERYVDIAAPWPYTQRVRVSAISHPVGKAMPRSP